MRLRKIGTALRLVFNGDVAKDVKLAIKSYDRSSPAVCSCCGFEGKFAAAGYPSRGAIKCPTCGSRERHRLLAIALEHGVVDVSQKRVLHFAPEPYVSNMLTKRGPSLYQTSSYPDYRADLRLDIEQLELADATYDLIVCLHVLEHVDDRKALAELHRVLAPGGHLIAMVPIVEGWSETFEDATKSTETDRELYFGQFDHVRFYGSDFRKRIVEAGFSLSEFTANGSDSVVYRLERGEKVFCAAKAA